MVNKDLHIFINCAQNFRLRAMRYAAESLNNSSIIFLY